jgi:hypothetical protein
MIHLSRETEVLALRLAAAQRVSVEDAIREALEARARVAGIIPSPAGHDSTGLFESAAV